MNTFYLDIFTEINTYVNNFALWIGLYSLIGSVYGALKLSKWIKFMFKTRDLRRVWGFRNGETVIVVCSELDEPEARKNTDPREFYYHYKYGDIDAYIEVIITLLRLYPKIKLRVMSSGDTENISIDPSQNYVIIGGPDYNKYTAFLFELDKTQITYRNADSCEKSENNNHEIMICIKNTNTEYFHTTSKSDYGYFEKINNPFNHQKKIILLGGCHSMGVTSSVKSFSLHYNEHDEISSIVLANSKLVSRRIINRHNEFCLLIEAKKHGQNVIPLPIRNEDIILKTNA